MRGHHSTPNTRHLIQSLAVIRGQTHPDAEVLHRLEIIRERSLPEAELLATWTSNGVRDPRALLTEYTRRGWIAAAPFPVELFEIYGVYLLVRAGDGGIGDQGIASEVQLAYFTPRIPWSEIRTVLDIGGHIGSFAAWVKHKAPHARILSVEMEQGNAALNRLNLDGLAGVTSVRGVVRYSSGEGMVMLLNPDNSGGGAIVTEERARRDNCARRIAAVDAPLFTPEELTAQHGFSHIDLLKLDCEGCEFEVLSHISDALLSRVNWIVGEWHGPESVDTFNRETRYRLPAWFDLLETRFDEPDMASFIARRRKVEAALPTLNTGIVPTPQTGVNVIADLTLRGGLGEAARGVLDALLAADVPVSVIDIRYAADTRDDSLPARYAALQAGSAYPLNLMFYNPLDFARLTPEQLSEVTQGKPTIAYWLWELPRLPASAHPAFDVVDAVWTSSSYGQAAMQSVRPDLPVSVVPIPPRMSAPGNHTRADFGIPTGRFAFLCVFSALSSVTRKNPFGVIEAFRRAFPNAAGDPHAPVLVMKAHYAERMPDFARDLKAALASVGGLLITGDLPRESVADLMACCDALVSLHRAEGFGLPIAEAMALGKPVIATYHSANVDFMTTENSAPVSYRLTRVRREDFLPYEPWIAEIYGEGQVWADPDLDHAARWMRYLAEQSGEAYAMGRRAARDIQAHAGVERVAALAVAALNAVSLAPRRAKLPQAQITPVESVALDLTQPIPGSGWHKLEQYAGRDFRWTAGTDSTVEFTVGAGHPPRVELDILKIRRDPIPQRSLKLTANGAPVRLTWTERDSGVVTATGYLPAVPSDGLVRLTITLARARRPFFPRKARDPRIIGVAVCGLRLLPAGAPAAPETSLRAELASMRASLAVLDAQVGGLVAQAASAHALARSRPVTPPESWTARLSAAEMQLDDLRANSPQPTIDHLREMQTNLAGDLRDLSRLADQLAQRIDEQAANSVTPAGLALLLDDLRASQAALTSRIDVLAQEHAQRLTQAEITTQTHAQQLIETGAQVQAHAERLDQAEWDARLTRGRVAWLEQQHQTAHPPPQSSLLARALGAGGLVRIVRQIEAVLPELAAAQPVDLSIYAPDASQIVIDAHEHYGEWLGAVQVALWLIASTDAAPASSVFHHARSKVRPGGLLVWLTPPGVTFPALDGWPPPVSMDATGADGSPLSVQMWRVPDL